MPLSCLSPQKSSKLTLQLVTEDWVQPCLQYCGAGEALQCSASNVSEGGGDSQVLLGTAHHNFGLGFMVSWARAQP